MREGQNERVKRTRTHFSNINSKRKIIFFFSLKKKKERMENNQAKGASKWLTSRRLIDFDPFLSQFLIATVCERESLFFPFFFKLKKNCGWGAEETKKKRQVVY